MSNRLDPDQAPPMQSFVKIKPSWNKVNTLSLTDVGKSSPSHRFLTWQICLLRLFAKIKFFTKIYNFKLQNYFELSQDPDLCCQADRHEEGWTEESTKSKSIVPSSETCRGLTNQTFIKAGLILSRCKSGSIKSGQMIGSGRLEFE